MSSQRYHARSNAARKAIPLVSDVLSRSEQSPGGVPEVLDEVPGSALVRKCEGGAAGIVQGQPCIFCSATTCLVCLIALPHMTLLCRDSHNTFDACI